MASTQTGDSTTDQAKERAQQAGEQVREKAQEATDQARGRVRDEVDRRSTDAGEQATSVADAIRQASQQLREQGKDQAARPMDQAADRMESAGRWLRDSDGDAILRDAEDFGRRNPLAVAAGGLAVGFALSRLLKASSRDRYHGSSGGSAGGTSRAGALPRPTTTPPRDGIAVPDLPAPPAGRPVPPPVVDPTPPAGRPVPPPSPGGGPGAF
jgi:ElaB/YqjD/DUF883 family membrane-anchored ribosome-binding protein